MKLIGEANLVSVRRQYAPAPTAGARRAGLVAAAVMLILLLVAASLCVGALSTSPAQTLHILTTGFSAIPTPDEAAVLHYRLPRTIVIVVVGVALGLAGTLIQGHTRNPLADPGLLGISAGAAAAIVVGIYFFAADDAFTMLVLAFAGSAVATTSVFLIGGGRQRGSDPVSLVVAGAAIAALLVAITTTIVLRSPDALDAFRFWTAGSVAVSEGRSYLPALIPLAVGAVLALASGPGLNLLAMGHKAAGSLGLNVPRLRLVGLCAITLLAGAATAVAGPLAFLGLIAPHLARGLVGADYRAVLPVAGVCATGILLVADMAGRVISDREVPAGVMLVLVGVPFFLVVIRRTRFQAA